MKHTLLFLFMLLPFSVYSQIEPRKLLRGKIVADSLNVENVTVNNVNTNLSAVTDRFGEFWINAREHDTLVFSGLAFEAKSMVVEKSDFEFEMLKIKLGMVVNALKEVIIYPTKLTGNLDSDSRKIKTKEILLPASGKLPTKYYEVDANTKIKTNPSNPVMESALQGVNFLALGKLIKNIFVKPKPKSTELPYVEPDMIFADAVKLKFSYHFFTETLKIKHEEIGLFLNFCDTPEVREKRLLSSEKTFELTDYLISKGEEFHKKK